MSELKGDCIISGINNQLHIVLSLNLSINLPSELFTRFVLGKSSLYFLYVGEHKYKKKNYQARLAEQKKDICTYIYFYTILRAFKNTRIL